jgi:hypothetical protein
MGSQFQLWSCVPVQMFDELLEYTGSRKILGCVLAQKIADVISTGTLPEVQCSVPGDRSVKLWVGVEEDIYLNFLILVEKLSLTVSETLRIITYSLLYDATNDPDSFKSYVESVPVKEKRKRTYSKRVSKTTEPLEMDQSQIPFPEISDSVNVENKDDLSCSQEFSTVFKEVKSLQIKIPTYIYEKLQDYAAMDMRTVTNMAEFILCSIASSGSVDAVESRLRYFSDLDDEIKDSLRQLVD